MHLHGKYLNINRRNISVWIIKRKRNLCRHCTPTLAELAQLVSINKLRGGIFSHSGVYSFRHCLGVWKLRYFRVSHWWPAAVTRDLFILTLSSYSCFMLGINKLPRLWKMTRKKANDEKFKNRLIENASLMPINHQISNTCPFHLCLKVEQLNKFSTLNSNHTFHLLTFLL